MITKSAEETMALGKDIARHLIPGDIVTLIGELGSGKTTLTKGIAQGIGVKNALYVNSPSFVLIREYKGIFKLYHVDLYRLDSIPEVESLGIEEYLYSDGITVIEWAQKLKNLLPREHLRVELKIMDNNRRRINLKGFGKRYENISSRCLDKNN